MACAYDPNVRNAYAALKGQSEIATFNGVARTAPEDFILDSVKYQSKFLNGTNNTLKAVTEHFGKYQDGSMNYSIPKDQYEIIEGIMVAQDSSDLSDKSIRSILQKVKEIESLTGRSFQDVVKPSVSNYSDVQLGKVGETVSEYQDKIVDENQIIEDDIQKKAEKQRDLAEAKKGPSVGEGIKVAGIAAAITASLNAITVVYGKIKSGKKMQDFNKEDWIEIGLSSTKAGAKGGITAGSIYTLTHLTSLSAPFAGAVTSASMGLVSLMADLKKDQISMDEFVTQGQILCLEAGIAATGGALGQMLIPIPVLGSIIGTVAANFVWEFAKDRLGEREGIKANIKCLYRIYLSKRREGISRYYL